MLVLDAGDYSMGTAFGAASRETGGELQLMSLMGYDATTFGNHDFDLGPDGLGKSIGVAAKAGRIPAVLASNTSFAGDDATLADLQRLAKAGVIRRHLVIERGGIRFGIFGVLGKEAQFYTTGAGAVTFSDAIETAKEMVTLLRDDREGGCRHLPQPRRRGEREGRALHRRRRRAPGQGRAGHRRGDRRPQPHRTARGDHRQRPHPRGPDRDWKAENLGELVITLDGDKLTVESYRLYPIDDTIAGDRAIADEIDKLKKSVTAAVFASRGYSIDQPLAVAPRDLPNTFTDIAAGTLLANLCHRRLQKGHESGHRLHRQRA